MKHEITVAQNGSGDFFSIAEAMDSIANPTVLDPVEIIIRPGVYRETLVTKDWVNLIGEDREKCIISYDGDIAPLKHLRMKHTICSASNTLIKNLTISGQHVKYCIHSDGRRDYLLTLENCLIRRECTDGDIKQYPFAFGIGLRGKQHIVMENCLVEADSPIYMHNWDKQKSSCSMSIEKCVLNGKNISLYISPLGSEQRDFLVIHDSVLNGIKAITYVNHRDARHPTRAGKSEIEVVGSGNTVNGPADCEIKDDSTRRLSGLDLTGFAGTSNTIK
jgi:hypothetical protein